MEVCREGNANDKEVKAAYIEVCQYEWQHYNSQKRRSDALQQEQT